MAELLLTVGRALLQFLFLSLVVVVVVLFCFLLKKKKKNRFDDYLIELAFYWKKKIRILSSLLAPQIVHFFFSTFPS